MSPLRSCTASSWAPPACKMLIHLDSLVLDSPLVVSPHPVSRLACHLLEVLIRRRGSMLAIEVALSLLVNGQCVVQQDRGLILMCRIVDVVARLLGRVARLEEDLLMAPLLMFRNFLVLSPPVHKCKLLRLLWLLWRMESASMHMLRRQSAMKSTFLAKENSLQNDIRQYYDIYPGAWLDDAGTTLAGQNPKHLDEIEDLVLREEIRNADSVDEQPAKWTQAVNRANERSHKVKKYRCLWCFWPATLEAHGPYAPNAQNYDVRCHMTGVRGSRRQKPCEKRSEGATGREDLIKNKHKLAKHSFSVIAKHMNEIEDGVP